MKNAFLVTVVRFSTQLGLVFFCILLERYFNLYALSSWILYYLIIRGVTFAQVLALGIFVDTCLLHALGSTPILLSFQLFFMALAKFIYGDRRVQWLVGIVSIGAVTMWRSRAWFLPFNFWIVSLFFLGLMVFGKNIFKPKIPSI